jgi:hypothetical protein
MRRSHRAWVACACLVLAATIGCGRAVAHSPIEAVQLWFDLLGRDPERLLGILTDEFHERHGLMVSSLEGWSWGKYWNVDTIRKIDPELTPIHHEDGLESAKEAFVLVQAAPTFRNTALALKYQVEQERNDGTTARVVTQVRLERGAHPMIKPNTFQQIFYLKSDPDGWRIDRIVQDRIKSRNEYVAFVAFPSEARRLRIAEALPALEPW